jgi:large subunit ribosomal protein L10
VTLRLEGKKAIVAEVAEVARNATSVVAANYAGLTVSQVTELRKQARNAGVYMRVIRNTLARRAFEGTHFECMDPALVGPLVLAFSKEDPGAAARLFKEYAKKFDKLEVKALSIDGALLPANDLNKLASLPTRNEAIALLMSVMNAPITKFVRTLAEPHAQLVRVVAAIRDKKQQEA